MVLLAFDHLLQAKKIYFSDRANGDIIRMDVDGSNFETVVNTGSSNFRGVDVDAVNGKIYWCDNGADTISRANLDGSGVEVLQDSGLGFPTDIKVNLTLGKVYWADQQRNVIERANLDGTGYEQVVQTPKPYFIYPDTFGGRIYWGEYDGGRIVRSDFSGQSIQVMVTGITGEVRGVQVEQREKRLYWCNRNGGLIQTVRLDGRGGVKTLFTGLDTPHGLRLDAANGYIYWADTGTNGTTLGLGRAVVRGRIDGSGEPEAVMWINGEPWQVAIDFTTDYAEWRAEVFEDDAANDAVSGPEADPDGDGFTNLQEYAFGTPADFPGNRGPMLHSSFQMQETEDQLAFTFAYVRRHRAMDVEYAVQVSHDHEDWMSGSDADAQFTASEERVYNSRDGTEIVEQTLFFAEPEFRRLYVQARATLTP